MLRLSEAGITSALNRLRTISAYIASVFAHQWLRAGQRGCSDGVRAVITEQRKGGKCLLTRAACWGRSRLGSQAALGRCSPSAPARVNTRTGPRSERHTGGLSFASGLGPCDIMIRPDHDAVPSACNLLTQRQPCR